MAILGFIAVPSSGKTLAAVHRTIMLKAVQFKLFNPNYGIYANMNLKLPKELSKSYVLIEDYQQIRDMENGVFLFDEMWEWVDSRVSPSKQNKFWSSWSIKTRKGGIDLLYTEQYEKLLDKRIRKITNYISRPFQRGFNYQKTLDSKYKQPVYDYTQVPIIDVKREATIEEYLIINDSIFSLYDTFEEPKDLSGGTYIDEGNEIIEKLKNDKIIDLYDKKGAIKGHIEEFYKVNSQVSEYVYIKVYEPKSNKRVKK